MLYSSNNRYPGNYSVTLLRALYGVLYIVHSTGTALASRASALLRSISGDLSRGDHPSVTDPVGIDSASPSTGQRYGLSPLYLYSSTWWRVESGILPDHTTNSGDRH